MNCWRNRYQRDINDVRTDVAPRIAAICFTSGFIFFLIFLTLRMEEESCDNGCLSVSHRSEMNWLMCKESCDKMSLSDLDSAVANMQVSCGNHEAATCKECPEGNGSNWCHGDCTWVDGKCSSDRTATRDMCHRKCEKTEHDTSKVKYAETLCLKRCNQNRNWWTHLFTFFGILNWFVTTPLIAKFRASCFCNCCAGPTSCSQRLLFSILSWVAYGFSVVMAGVVLVGFNDSVFIMIYMTLSIFSIVSMTGSRFLYSREQEKLEQSLINSKGMGMDVAVIGNPVSQPGSVAPALVYELQAQVLDLASKVRGLERFVNMPSLQSPNGKAANEVELRGLTSNPGDMVAIGNQNNSGKTRNSREDV